MVGTVSEFIAPLKLNFLARYNCLSSQPSNVSVFYLQKLKVFL